MWTSGAGKAAEDPTVREQLAYCVPHGIPFSVFLGWDEEDQDAALGYLRWQNTRCRDCGTRKEDWKSDRFAFVGAHEQCPGCVAIEQEREAVPKKMRGAHVFLVPREVAEMQAQMGRWSG